MRNQDVSVLAELVEKGTSVRIITEDYRSAEPQDIEAEVARAEATSSSVQPSVWLSPMAR